jgi:hypothetical protein
MTNFSEWTDELDDDLKRHWQDRWDLKWIARTLGTTVDRVRDRVRRLQLPPRVKNRASPRNAAQPEVVARKCLRCGRAFYAESKFLRLCVDTCRSTGL